MKAVAGTGFGMLLSAIGSLPAYSRERLGGPLAVIGRGSARERLRVKPLPWSVVIVACMACTTTSVAADLTGRIATLAPFLDTQNQLYVSLTGTPGGALPDGSPTGSCSNAFAVAQMSDANFKSFIYPLLLMAKAADQPITLRTRGCLGAYPIIVGVDYSPR